MEIETDIFPREKYNLTISIFAPQTTDFPNNGRIIFSIGRNDRRICGVIGETYETGSTPSEAS